MIRTMAFRNSRSELSLRGKVAALATASQIWQLLQLTMSPLDVTSYQDLEHSLMTFHRRPSTLQSCGLEMLRQ